MFGAICSELSNRNARRILSEIIRGNNTSTSIREATGLTIQYIIRHLAKLKELGFIESRGKESSSLRGRSPTQYNATKVAALLVPFHSNDQLEAMKEMKRQSLKKLAKKGLLYITTILTWFVAIWTLWAGRPGFRTANVPVPNLGPSLPPSPPQYVFLVTWLFVIVPLIVFGLLFVLSLASRSLNAGESGKHILPN